MACWTQAPGTEWLGFVVGRSAPPVFAAQERIMAIKGSHGVIIVYHGEGESVQCEVHLPDGCEVVREAMKSKTWERYRSLQKAMESGFAPCMFCF